MNISEREKAQREYWRRINLLEKLQKKNAAGKPYFLLDGPPYANYTPHVGHIRNTVYKDLYIRWEFQKGKNVLFQPGFDTHGLPIENMVEKKLALTSKKDIQKLGVSKFMKECRESAALNKDLWMNAYDLLGSWYAWKDPYLTYENDYIESVWWSFKQLWEKDMVYEGKKPVFWCPKCETALAGYEATDSYKIVSDPAVYVKFPLGEEKDTYLLVYTTTPWTLPANVAILVAPEETYVRAKTDQGTIILAKERLEVLDNAELTYDISEEFKGKELVGKSYESLLDVPIQKELTKTPNALHIYASVPILKERVASKVAAKKGLQTGDIYEDFVTVSEGTGLVHCAPGHGKTDNEIGKIYDLPELSPVDDQCKLTEEAGQFADKFVKDADHDIADWLHKQGLLLRYERIEHSYPLCWRCKSPLIFRLSKQWFLKVDMIKDQMLKTNEQVNWQPNYAGERFSQWVANADDWNFSRQRYWGVPIPLWRGESGNMLVLGSKEELRRLAKDEIGKDFDLHTVNDVILIDPKTKEEMHRINDIFDVWYDSGSAPYASMHYPFENKELFEHHFPISRINESQDQVRGWFYSLMFCSVGIFGKAPYKTVSMPGWVLDDKGEKMSKSQGNMLYAKDTLEKYGADLVRFYYCWEIAPEQTNKFNTETVGKDIARFFMVWDNLVRLITQKEVCEAKLPSTNKSLAVEDRWLLSRLHRTIRDFRSAIEEFNVHNAGRLLMKLIVDDLSRTYIQLVRDRLTEETVRSIIAITLRQTAILSAAITPHRSEEVYQNLKPFFKDTESSVHLVSIPEPDSSLIDERLESDMERYGQVVAATLSARERGGISVRWPLSEVIVNTEHEETAKSLQKLESLFLSQTNAKAMRLGSIPIKYSAKPNYESLGKSFGTSTGEAVELFKKNTDRIIGALTGKEKKITLGDFTFLPNHIVLQKIIPQGYAVGEWLNGSVYIPTDLSPDLIAEGLVREITRRLQQLRKEASMEPQDKIKALVLVKSELVEKLRKHQTDLARKVGADEIIITDDNQKTSHDFSSQATVRGYDLDLRISKSS